MLVVKLLLSLSVLQIRLCLIQKAKRRSVRRKDRKTAHVYWSVLNERQSIAQVNFRYYYLLFFEYIHYVFTKL